MAPFKRRIKIFLKGAYFVNLLAFLAAMVVVTVRQNNNYYQCESITVRSKCISGFYSLIIPILLHNVSNVINFSH